MKNRSIRLWALVALLTGAVATDVAAATEVRIGLVVDGPNTPASRAELRDLVLEEVVQLMAGEFEVSFPTDKILIADDTVEGIERALARLLADPTVDLVLAGGPISSHLAARRPLLPKPVIAPLIVDPELQGIPLQGQASGIENLSYITYPASTPTTLKLFKEIAPFKKVALLASRSILDAIPELASHYIAAGSSMGVEVVAVPVAATAASVLEALTPDLEGVFIGLPLNLPDAEIEPLVEGLIARRLPSFWSFAPAVSEWVDRGWLLRGLVVGGWNCRTRGEAVEAGRSGRRS